MTILRIKKIEESDNFITFKEIYTQTECQVERSKFVHAMKNLYYWRRDTFPSSFSDMLYQLLNKADDENKMKIFKGFPEATICYLLWYTNKDKSETTFFCTWLVNEV